MLLPCQAAHTAAVLAVSTIVFGAVIGAYAWASRSMKRAVILAAVVTALLGGAAVAYAGIAFNPYAVCKWCSASDCPLWPCWTSWCGCN